VSPFLHRHVRLMPVGGVGVGWSVKGEEWHQVGSSDRCRPFGGAQRRSKGRPDRMGPAGDASLDRTGPHSHKLGGFSEPQPSHRQSSEPSGNTRSWHELADPADTAAAFALFGSSDLAQKLGSPATSRATSASPPGFARLHRMSECSTGQLGPNGCGQNGIVAGSYGSTPAQMATGDFSGTAANPTRIAGHAPPGSVCGMTRRTGK